MSVKQVTRADVNIVALTLARSFEDNVLFRWLFGDQPLDRLRQSFRSQLRVQYVPRGFAKTVAGLHGAALWNPPGRRFSPSLWDSIRLAPGHFALLLPWAARKALQAFSTMDAHHPAEPHVHLAVLGVDPSHQRSGIGTLLVDEGLRRADTDGLPVYLDTDEPANVPYYERFGFQVTCEFDIPLGGPRMYGMLRQAKIRS
ncbi:MAG: GNAT family N-acetyltransferase [Actinobacteria bacterium]|nr:GNAT family N-acetyltransferase [Actinomycetota bacterium]